MNTSRHHLGECRTFGAACPTLHQHIRERCDDDLCDREHVMVIWDRPVPEEAPA